MNAIEAYVSRLRRRLWMLRALREERCQEITDHLLQREAVRGRPFVDTAEIDTLMGASGSIACELNAAVPWWRSRMPMRLLFAPIVLLIAGDALLYVAAELLDALGAPLVGWLVISGPMALQYTIPVAVALYARRLCVRPLHALVAIAVPMLLLLAESAWNIFRPGERDWHNVVSISSGALATTMQFAALAWAACRASLGPWRGAGLVLALPVLPLLATELLFAATHAAGWDAAMNAMFMALTTCAVLVPAAVYHRLAGGSACRRHAA